MLVLRSCCPEGRKEAGRHVLNAWERLGHKLNAPAGTKRQATESTDTAAELVQHVHLALLHGLRVAQQHNVVGIHNHFAVLQSWSIKEATAARE